MDIAGLVRVAQALMTAALLLIAAGGVLIAWAAGLLGQVNLVLAACAVIAPRVHRAFHRSICP